MGSHFSKLKIFLCEVEQFLNELKLEHRNCLTTKNEINKIIIELTSIQQKTNFMEQIIETINYNINIIDNALSQIKNLNLESIQLKLKVSELQKDLAQWHFNAILAIRNAPALQDEKVQKNQVAVGNNINQKQ